MRSKGYRIKVFNTINFQKSMRYNPLAYVHSEKDILKLVNVLITNTKGEGTAGDPFWTKAETLLYTALISYICTRGPKEERCFGTLVSMINAMEVREDDEDFKNKVDEMFDELEKAEPQHFAVRQYRKFKLAAGKTLNRSLSPARPASRPSIYRRFGTSFPRTSLNWTPSATPKQPCSLSFPIRTIP